jgi:hypothetical protein
VAVIVGEAAVRIRGEADAGEIKNDVEPGVRKALEDAGESGSDAFSTKMAAGIAGAGLAIAGGFASALENAAVGDKLAAQLGATGAYAEDLGTIAGDLYANAYGESLGDVNEALRSVIQSGAVMEDASNEQLSSVTASAMNLASAFDVDVAGASQAAGRLVQTGLAANAEEAFDIITRGFQQGADRSGDFLDVLGEYGTTFSELGLQGPQAVGLINQALAAGIPNADFAADALREMGIRGREGSDAARTALESLGLSADTYFANMRAGGPAAAHSLDVVLDTLRNTEDPAVRSAAAFELVGTQYEDLGDTILNLDPSEAAASLGTIEGAAASMGDTLNNNASTNLTTFWRSAQGAFVDLLGGQVIPIVERVASFLSTNLGPSFATVGGIVGDNIVPPLRDLFSWLGQNETLVRTVAAVVGTVLVGALTVWATRSTIAAAQNTVAWFSTAAASTTSAGRQSASALQVVTGWVLMAAQATWQGLRIAAVWTAQIVASAVTGAASFAVQVARVIAGWVLMAVQAAVQGAIMVASFAVTAAGVVASWVLMGAQALLAAARMAAAWFIALGPVGWVIAAVIGLVALVIANWETVRAWTVAAWNAVVGAVVGAWQWISSTVSAGVSWVVAFVSGLPGMLLGALASLGALLAGLFSAAWSWAAGAVSAGISTVLSFVGSLPGRILGALAGLGSLLVGVGGDLIRGLVRGISGAASFVGDVAGSIVRAIRGFINSNVIDRLNNLLEFTIAGVHINPPDIPRLHSGGVFDSGQGEGLAVLRDDELVATPEQRRVADDLLRGLLAGNLPTPRAAADAPAGGVSITNQITQLPGEDAAVLAARVTQGTVWNLNVGITRTVGATP